MKSSKKVVLKPTIFRGRVYPDFGHIFSNRTYLRALGRFSLISVQRARRGLTKEKKEKIEEEDRYNRDKT